MEKKFVVDQKSLLNVLSSMQPICTKRTTLDATASILFQVGHRELILKSTDLEISLQASCDLIESTLLEPESFLVTGRRIFEVVKELEGAITCKLTRGQLSLQAGAVRLSLNMKETEEFPPFPERIENLMHMDAGTLRSMLDNVAFLIPQNNANTALNGLFVEITPQSCIMTTTDGHCLAQTISTTHTLEQPRSWLLPRRAVFEVKKLLETSQDATIFIGVCGQQVVFSGEMFNFFTKLLADTFPQYRPILDKTSFVPATVERGRFIKTLRRSTCLLSGQFLATRFSFGADNLKVSMHNKEVGNLEEEIPLATSPDFALDIRFYAPYLLNGLQAFTDDKVQLFLKNSAKPIIFETVGNPIQLTYLVMPVSSSQ